jgi:SAM-dependent methyltransferase
VNFWKVKMAHPQQRAFCESVKQRFPEYFSGVFALDIGSLDINGNNQYLFDSQSLYLGVDVAEGRNVDVVAVAHTSGMPKETFDVVVSTECLEHDRYWDRTLRAAVDMLRPGGLLLVTCATVGRPEHGTRRTTPQDAPLLGGVDDGWADYYRNLTEQDFRAALDFDHDFKALEFLIGEETHDLYFWGLKQGEFLPRRDRSINLVSHPVRIQESVLRAELSLVHDELHEVRMQLSKTREMHGELSVQVERQQAQLADATRELVGLQTELVSGQADIAQARDDLARVYASRSWRMTRPVRVLHAGMSRAKGLGRRAVSALRYLQQGDFDGLKRRARAIQMERALRRTVDSSPPAHWGIMATPHTLFLAHLVAERLHAHGWSADIVTHAPAGFPHEMYVVICAQMFDTLPPGAKRIVYQMEQSVSSRWFTDEYLKVLDESSAVLDYSLTNIEFLVSKGVQYPRVYYVPIGASDVYMPDVTAQPVVKKYDVLFYGDAKSSPRRRKLLDELRKHFDVRVCSEVFGADMGQEIQRARVVINIHYYENALLETTRIQECLSLGVPVVSESSQDQEDYPELRGAVTFFRAGDAKAMIDAVRVTLSDTYDSLDVVPAVELGRRRFAFMFDRVLVAMNLLAADKLSGDLLPISAQADRFALSMPETIERRRVFEANRPQQCTVFDGVRLSPGWVGCGLSYVHLARHALLHNVRRLTILEDDVLLPDDFEDKMRTVHAYLDVRAGKWDIFAGVIASLHPDVKILHIDTFQGMRFVTIDKMVSMVCNIYSERALHLLSKWNWNNRDPHTNTIDRFLERHPGLRVVVALPFLAGHREALESTLWGITNERYSDMIANSERELIAKADEFAVQGTPHV